MPVVSLLEASRCTGISRQQLYRHLRRGDLKAWERGKGPRGERLLELQGLRERCLATQRVRIDTLHWEGRREDLTEVEGVPEAHHPLELLEPAEEEQEVELDSERVAEWANAQLMPEAWDQPPWPLLRWATLLDAWADAQQLQLEHGDFTPEKWARIEAEADEALEAMSDE